MLVQLWVNPPFASGAKGGGEGEPLGDLVAPQSGVSTARPNAWVSALANGTTRCASHPLRRGRVGRSV